VSVYVDASVLVALFFTPDVRSARADAFLRIRVPILLVSDFAAAELASAVARLVRMRHLEAEAARRAFVAFDAWIARAAERILATSADLTAAAAFLRRLEALDSGDIDTAESLVDLAKAASKKLKGKDGYADLADASGGDGQEEEEPYGDPDADDEEDDTGRRVSKQIWYPHSRQPPEVHDEMTSPVSQHMPETYSLGTTPTTEQPLRHKFDSRIEFVMDRDQCSRSEAMSRARQEFPETYADYQDALACQSTAAQATARGGKGVAKSRSATFEDLVRAEMLTKGVNSEVAAQRIMQQHGSFALRSRMAKRAETASDTLQKHACWIAENTGADLTSALRKARELDPALYDATQL
jgi:predicted nucleic acid-binding protein